jgi:hypothetical protein
MRWEAGRAVCCTGTGKKIVDRADARERET